MNKTALPTPPHPPDPSKALPSWCFHSAVFVGGDKHMGRWVEGESYQANRRPGGGGRDQKVGVGVREPRKSQ